MVCSRCGVFITAMDTSTDDHKRYASGDEGGPVRVDDHHYVAIGGSGTSIGGGKGSRAHRRMHTDQGSEMCDTECPGAGAGAGAGADPSLDVMELGMNKVRQSRKTASSTTTLQQRHASVSTTQQTRALHEVTTSEGYRKIVIARGDGAKLQAMERSLDGLVRLGAITSLLRNTAMRMIGPTTTNILQMYPVEAATAALVYSALLATSKFVHIRECAYASIVVNDPSVLRSPKARRASSRGDEEDGGLNDRFRGVFSTEIRDLPTRIHAVNRQARACHAAISAQGSILNRGDTTGRTKCTEDVRMMMLVVMVLPAQCQGWIMERYCTLLNMRPEIVDICVEAFQYEMGRGMIHSTHIETACVLFLLCVSEFVMGWDEDTRTAQFKRLHGVKCASVFKQYAKYRTTGCARVVATTVRERVCTWLSNQRFALSAQRHGEAPSATKRRRRGAS